MTNVPDLVVIMTSEQIQKWMHLKLFITNMERKGVKSCKREELFWVENVLFCRSRCLRTANDL